MYCKEYLTASTLNAGSATGSADATAQLLEVDMSVPVLVEGIKETCQSVLWYGRTN